MIVVTEDFIGGAEGFESLWGDISDDSDCKARAWEGVTPDHVLGEAQVFAYVSDFILEQVAEGLDKLEAQLGGQASYVVVQLYIGGGIAVFGARFDYVGVESTLGEEFSVGDFFSFGFEGFYEFGADDFAFFLGVGNASESSEELL